MYTTPHHHLHCDTLIFPYIKKPETESAPPPSSPLLSPQIVFWGRGHNEKDLASKLPYLLAARGLPPNSLLPTSLYSSPLTPTHRLAFPPLLLVIAKGEQKRRRTIKVKTERFFPPPYPPSRLLRHFTVKKSPRREIPHPKPQSPFPLREYETRIFGLRKR